MIRVKTSKSIFGAVVFLAFIIVSTYAMDRLSTFLSLKNRLQSRSVPSGMLNYGSLAKIMKQLGLVRVVPNDNTLFSHTDIEHTDIDGNLFQRKRQITDFMYSANPGGMKSMPASNVISPEDFREGWPLISIVANDEDLYDPEKGIILNYQKKGIPWERLSSVSYYDENGVLAFSGNAGLRLHGGKLRKERPGFRLYFRKQYGVQKLAGEILGLDVKSIKTLVIHDNRPQERLFTNDLAFDIARRIGCVVPVTKPVLFFLNGKSKGIYFISEHLSRRQWREHFSHDNFVLYRFKGENDKEAKVAFIGMQRWLSNGSVRFTMEEALKYIDIDNFTRWTISVIFCGTGDAHQGLMLLNKSEVKGGARYFFVNWDMEASFGFDTVDSEKYNWQKSGFEIALPGNGRMVPRAILLARLLRESPEYKSYFIRMNMDILNHLLTPDFFAERVGFYKKLLDSYGGEKRFTPEMEEFFKYRGDFIREQICSYFKICEIYTCRIRNYENRKLIIDGYPESSDYRGKYFKNWEMTAEPHESCRDSFLYWLVNGQKISKPRLAFGVVADMEIIPVFKKTSGV